MTDAHCNLLFPHLPRPGRREDDMPKDKPGFPVRLGTSLARSSTDKQIRMLGVRPVLATERQFLDTHETFSNNRRHSGKSSPATSDKSGASLTGPYLSVGRWHGKSAAERFSPATSEKSVNLRPKSELSAIPGRVEVSVKVRPRTSNGRRERSYYLASANTFFFPANKYLGFRRNSEVALPTKSSITTNGNEDMPSKTSTVKVNKRRRLVQKAVNEEIIIHTSDHDSEPPLGRFRRIATTVRRVAAICIALKRYATKESDQKMSFQEMYLHLQSDLDDVLAFNPSSFGKVEPAKQRLKELLSIQKEHRTTLNIKSILSLLHGNSAFHDYPPEVRVALAKCMTYQCYGTRRIVLKQGHQPMAFYIILTGILIVNLKEKDKSTGQIFERTAHDMGPGETFGEIALLEGGPRKATIVCKTHVELLVIPKKDFEVIIKEPLMKQRDEHVTFCKNLALFQDFPCEKFVSNPMHFFYHYFRAGSVVVRNGRESKYIIVVKAGKCKVVCEFQESNRPISQEEHLLHCELKDLFPDVEHDENQTSLGSTFMQNVSAEKHNGNTNGDANEKCQDIGSSKATGCSKIDEDIFLKTTFSEMSAARDIQPNHAQDLHSTLPPRKEGMRNQRHRGISANPSSNSKTCFAQIAELETGAVFGLDSLLKPGHLVTSLISDGAECIFVSKKFFLRESNVKVLRVVTDMVQGYPKHDFIISQVRNYRKWKRYKKDVVKDILARDGRKIKAFVGGTPACK